MLERAATALGFGPLEMGEVYSSFDEVPRLCALTPTQQPCLRVLALCISDDDDDDDTGTMEYLYLSMPAAHLDQVIAGTWPLRDVFTQAVPGQLWRVTFTPKNGDVEVVTLPIRSCDLADADLPKPGARMRQGPVTAVQSSCELVNVCWFPFNTDSTVQVSLRAGAGRHCNNPDCVEASLDGVLLGHIDPYRDGGGTRDWWSVSTPYPGAAALNGFTCQTDAIRELLHQS